MTYKSIAKSLFLIMLCCELSIYASSYDAAEKSQQEIVKNFINKVYTINTCEQANKFEEKFKNHLANDTILEKIVKINKENSSVADYEIDYMSRSVRQEFKNKKRELSMAADIGDMIQAAALAVIGIGLCTVILTPMGNDGGATAILRGGTISIAGGVLCYYGYNNSRIASIRFDTAKRMGKQWDIKFPRYKNGETE